MKITKKLISIVLVAALCVSTFACVFSVNAADFSKYKVYTSIGDSNSSGYGSTGYIDNRLPAPNAIKTLVAKGLDAELRDFGTGGFRTHEIRYMLCPGYEMDWEYADRCDGKVKKSDLDAFKDDYVKAIVDADVISIAAGSNDFFGDIFGTALAKLFVPSEKLAEIRAKCDAESEYGAKLIALCDSLDSVFKVMNFVSELVTLLRDAIVEFRENWDAVIGRIYELNPDVQIVVVNPVNSFNNSYVSLGEVQIDISFIFDIIMGRYQNYVRFLSPYAKSYYYVDATDIKLSRVDFKDEKLLSDPDYRFALVHFHDDEQAEIARRIIEVLETDGASQSNKVSVAATVALLWDVAELFATQF